MHGNQMFRLIFNTKAIYEFSTRTQIGNPFRLKDHPFLDLLKKTELRKLKMRINGGIKPKIVYGKYKR